MPLLMRETILVVNADASASLRETEHALQHVMHYRTFSVPSLDKVLEWVRLGMKPIPDVILLDIYAGGGKDCIAALRTIKSLRPDLPVITLTAYGDDETASEAIRAGAYDFLSKPVPMERLRLSLQNVLKLQRMSNYITWLERRMAGHMELGDMVGESPEFLEVLSLARQASASRMPVWIEGETGTGKTLVARAIHGSSDRVGKPFVIVNCEMLPPHLARGMLFGQEKNVEPGKMHFILGKIREADQGTLLLQEVGALPLDVQQQLLDMLKQGAVTPVGSQTGHPVNVRLVCTQGKSDKYDLEQHAFHQKLSQAFQVLSIAMPPLRNRKGDIQHLAEHFLVVHATSENKYISGITDRAMQWLANNVWPGNVGQLANLLWRAVMLCENNVLDVSDLKAVQKNRSIYIADYSHEAATMQGSVLIDDQGKVKTLKSVEEEAIRFALQQAGGCMTRAARSLGIGRSTLYRKVSELSLGDHISRANQTTRPIMNVSSSDRS